MKSKLPLTPLLAAALFAVPSLASAGGGGISGIDTNLSFALRLTGEGETTERNNIFRNRFDVARLGTREVLVILAEIRSTMPVSDGEDNFRFPPGSRIMVYGRSGDVVVTDRSGNEIFNASPYIYVNQQSDSIQAGTFNDNSGDQNSTRMYLTSLGFQFPNLFVNVQGGESLAGLEGETRGVATERFTRRVRRRGEEITESVNASSRARVSGSGREDGNNLSIEGSLNQSGRETFTALP